jgi:hypothetical protein
MSSWAILQNPPQLVAVGSAIGTFVALVLADEQQARMRNGIFSAAAGSAFGGLAGLFADDSSLLIVGFVGSAVGALAGWVVHLLLSFMGAFRWGRLLLEYQHGGIESVRQRVILNEQQLLLSGLREWRRSYVNRLSIEATQALAITDASQRERIAEMVIMNWLQAFIEVYGLVFEMANKSGYRSRATVIVFGRDASRSLIGKHWLTYSGKLPQHKLSRTFPDYSIGYKVLSEEYVSPYFSTAEEAKKVGVARADPTYRPFYTFRVNNHAVLAVDWPNELSEEDPYLIRAKETFHTEVTPAIASLLQAWGTALPKVVSLSSD